MNVLELTLKGESDPKLYACGKCGHLHSPTIYAAREDLAHDAARKAAEKCCAPKLCGCGAVLDSPWTACAPCRERNLLNRGQIIDPANHSGPVFADCGGEWGDGYSSDISAMIESCHNAGEPVPAYCHPCVKEVLGIDPTGLLEKATDQMHEGAYSEIVDADEMVAFITEWNKKQTCASYFPDYNDVIVLDKKRVEEILERPQKGGE